MVEDCEVQLLTRKQQNDLESVILSECEGLWKQDTSVNCWSDEKSILHHRDMECVRTVDAECKPVISAGSKHDILRLHADLIASSHDLARVH